jgi:hypothetical protein
MIHISTRLRLGLMSLEMIPGPIWKRSCIILYIIIAVGDPDPEWKIGMSLSGFISATFLCLSEAITWIVNAICRDPFLCLVS